MLANNAVIAVHQDPLGSQGRVHKDGELEVWAKTMRDGSRAVVLLNRGTSEQQITVTWEGLGYPAHLRAGVRDLWLGKDFGQFRSHFSAAVASHAVVMVRVSP
jgi:alpha-galactosidase